MFSPLKMQILNLGRLDLVHYLNYLCFVVLHPENPSTEGSLDEFDHLIKSCIFTRRQILNSYIVETFTTH